jgi:hypothetical protein
MMSAELIGLAREGKLRPWSRMLVMLFRLKPRLEAGAGDRWGMKTLECSCGDVNVNGTIATAYAEAFGQNFQ